MNVVVLSGSVARNKTRTVATSALELMQKNHPDHQYTFLDLADYQLPFSDGRHYQDYSGDAATVVHAIMEAEVLLIATPIYQAGMPGVLKNVFDLLPSDALEHTVTALIVTAGSMRHFMVPETQMRPILTYLKAQVLQQYVFVEERDFQGSAIANEDVFFRLQRLITEAFLQAEVQTMLREREENAFGF